MPITPAIAILTILIFPVLAAAALGLFAVTHGLWRRLPAHEVQQAVRAPAWLTVVVGAAISACTLWALLRLTTADETFFIPGPQGQPLLFADAYALWGCLLLGLALAGSAWVPAARRSLVPQAYLPFIFTILLAWCAVLVLCSAQVMGLLAGWLVLLLGCLGLWVGLVRPRRQVLQWEVALVLALAGILGTVGLCWLARLAPGEPLTTLWVPLMLAPPVASNGAVLLVVFAWIGPAAYLPWWLWMRRDDAALAWMPAALLLAVTGVLAAVRLLFLAFPANTIGSLPGAGVDYLFFIHRILSWLGGWGLVALLAGAGWQIIAAVRVALLRQTLAPAGLLRPLTLMAIGLLLTGTATALQAQHSANAVGGLLWLQVVWVGVITILLTSGGLLSALALPERAERSTLLAALGMALAMLTCLPGTPGFHALSALWTSLGAQAILVTFSLIAGVLASLVLLPYWTKRHAAPAPRAGVGWGILAPFLLALLLLVVGAAGHLAPNGLVTLVQESLLRAW